MNVQYSCYTYQADDKTISRFDVKAKIFCLHQNGYKWYFYRSSLIDKQDKQLFSFTDILQFVENKGGEYKISISLYIEEYNDIKEGYKCFDMTRSIIRKNYGVFVFK